MHGECAANEADVCAKFYRVIRNVFDDDELTVPPALTGHDVLEWDRTSHVRLHAAKITGGKNAGELVVRIPLYTHR